MKKLITILLAIVMTIPCSFSVFAAEKEGLNLTGYEIQPMYNSSEWYDQITGKITHPVTTDSPEWQTFNTHDEMLEACTIPDDILKEISTRELAELVLNYPMLTDYQLFSNIDQGMDIQIENFNGLRELLNRADGLETLMALYNDMELTKVNIPENILNAPSTSFGSELAEFEEQAPQAYADMEQGLKSDSQCQFIETLLEKFGNSISPTQQKNFDISKSKKDADRLSNYYYEQGTIPKANFVLKTPSGKVVSTSCYLYDRAEMTAAQKTAIKKDITKTYPKATILRDPTRKYNCHSYDCFLLGTL